MKLVTYIWCCFGTLFVVFYVSGVDGFLWWRRRRGCGAVNCEWGGWSAWGSCNHPCGNAGIQTRSRSISRQASCGGAGCSGPSSEKRNCNRFCKHGGTPKVGHCTCPDPYWGTCCEKPCTPIANCKLLTCTTGNDHSCNECNYKKSATLFAYRQKTSGGIANRICEQACSWRSDSSFCYPGKCPGKPSSCTCAPGYQSKNCLKISAKPSIMSCLLRVERRSASGAVEESVDATKCELTNNPVVYINVEINWIKTDWQSQFVGPAKSDYPTPPYVTSYGIGITQAMAAVSVSKAGTPGTGTPHSCSEGFSQNNPNKAVHSCKQDIDIGKSAKHGDTVKIDLRVDNGGFVKIIGEGSSGEQTKYYSGETTIHSASYIIDTEKPRHCSAAGGSCSKETMLKITNVFTKSGNIPITWDGWADDLSGIKEYELEVFKMKPFGNDLGQGEWPTPEKLLSTVKQKTVTVTDPAVYCALLTVVDVAGNHRYARRFFIFDNVNEISIKEADDSKLYVSSAAQNTLHLWITTLQKPNNDGPQVTVKWVGHFINEYHNTHKFLASILAHSPPLDEAYEDRTGVGANVRSMKEIANVNAIVKYQIAKAVDNKGGRTLTAATQFTDVPNFRTETTSIDVARTDGDSVKIWLKAFDVMGNTKTDSVLVHVDSSPPVTSNVWLSRHGKQQLAVHHSEDLFDLKLEFDAVDFHSGLKEIRWELQDKEDISVLHGDGNIAVRRPTAQQPACDPPLCYCIQKDEECYFRNYEITPDMSKMKKAIGDHDFDYHFVITVTNNAMLSSVYTYQITIDGSAPQSGVVSDSRPGQTDVDYQQSYELHASWLGFFDRESGILFYQYAFSEKCLQASDFSIPANQSVVETSDTFASTTVTKPGTYHCTVVAYNRALTPSTPACSDGSTIDVTAPSVVEVSVENARMKAGVVRDSEDRVWYITNDRHRIEIKTPSAGCRTKTNVHPKTVLYPVKEDDGKHNIDWEHLCEHLSDPGEHVFINQANLLSVSWFGSDAESGIEDYAVGLSSSGATEPDLSPYASTHAHRHYKLYHPNLVDEKMFYVHVKARNRAQKEIVEVIGPITVRLEPPTFNGRIQIALQGSHLVAKWSKDAFSPNDLQTQFISEYYFSVGRSSGSEKLLPYTSVSTVEDVAGVCERTEPPTCVAVSVDALQWHLHGRHTYHVSVKLVAVNGLERVVTSAGYEHNVGPPTSGLVYEIPVGSTSDMLSSDIDYQSSDSALHIEWRGFEHFDQPITYQLAIGTAQNLDDVVPFFDVDSSSKLIEQLTLTRLATYYATIRANTNDGSTTVSSDGITILPLDEDINGIKVMDGLPCLQDDASVDVTSDKDCGVDMDFQASRVTMAAHWVLPVNVVKFITNIKWRIEKKKGSNWEEVRELSAIEPVAYVIATDLHLDAGHKYRAAVQFCHPAGCLQLVHSDGVIVIPDPPVSAGIVETVLVNSTSSTIRFSWAPFKTGYAHLSGVDFMDRHEWTVLSRDEKDVQLYNWMPIVAEPGMCNMTADECSYEAYFTYKLEVSSCLVLALRGYSKVGLYSTVYKQLSGCEVASKQQLIVLDALGETEDANIHLDKKSHWSRADEEYTPYSSTLSAVWPTLRHPSLQWKIISDKNIQRWAFVTPDVAPSFHDYHCSSPAVLRCGETEENSVTVHNLALSEGERYYVCVFGNKTELSFETFSQTLDAVSECSNGIVPDLSPPQAGKVWIGSRQKQVLYQVDRTQLMIYWENFVDMEVYPGSSHESALLKYDYAIGTSAGGVDVQDFTSVVGLSNSVSATGLNLQDGHTYYVTVRATDHVGQTVKGYSVGVTIDTSPPQISDTPIDVGGAYQTSRQSQLSATWRHVFVDIESGILKYYWCIGSSQGFCDLMPYVETLDDSATSNVPNGIALHDGHAYYVSVQAINGAGLSRVVTASPTIIDFSAPDAGHVYEVAHGADDIDIDYSTDTSELRLRWHGFHDSHSHITDYRVSVGKCAGCDDVMTRSHVGLRTTLDLTDLSLEVGQRYYTTVEACNAAKVCTSAKSDGLIVDNTPPQAGSLLDGLAGEDIDYQSSRKRVSAHVYNAEDTDSGLWHMEWRVGTSMGGDDIVSATRLEIGQHMTMELKTPLPLAKRIYSTLKVTNKAGLSSEITSDGFFVDDTTPLVQKQVQLVETEGSINTNTLIWKTSLAAEWYIADAESSILEQFVSVITKEGTHIDVPTVKLYGNRREYTFTNVSLQDGGTYYVKVIACNGATLCTASTSNGILVDNSPPTAGAFAVETDHAASLTRHRQGSMLYNVDAGRTSLHLAWLGFSDPHTNIVKYHVAIGSSYGASDLLPNGGTVSVDHKDENPHEDEGFIQKYTAVINKAIQANELIYVSVWAENQVGLLSDRMHGTLKTIPAQAGSGSLELVRRCVTQSCEGHCTCAKHGVLVCAGAVGCNDVKGKSGYVPVSVYDVTNYKLAASTNEDDVDHTRSQCALAATWRPASEVGSAPVRYEWSIGLEGEPVGAGLLDQLHEPLWRETGSDRMAVYTAESSQLKDAILQPHEKYMFYVRAWYGKNDYGVYSSDGLMTDYSAPELSRAIRVVELASADKTADVDFISSTSQVVVMWKDVFRDAHSDILRYVVSIGHHRGASDVVSREFDATTTKTTFANLQLESTEMYYTTVTAYNKAGLFTDAFSDGFQVDLNPPVTGRVWDGDGPNDMDYSNDDTRVAASWHGFTDPESYIDHYVWCVGTAPGQSDVVACKDVGLSTSVSAPLTAVTSGTKLYSSVSAVNGAGLQSTPATTDGFVVDTTPPVAVHKFQIGQNVLLNPSFESDGSDAAVTRRVPSSWLAAGGDDVVNLHTADQQAQHALSYLELVTGAIKQSVTVSLGEKYRLMFYARSPNVSDASIGYVRLPNTHAAFMLPPAAQAAGWHRHIYYGVATETTMEVVIGVLGHRTGFLLDNVELSALSEGERATGGDPKDPESKRVQPVHVHVDHRGRLSAVVATWDMVDVESAPINYEWAIGTVRGGAQIQDFTAVGRETHAKTDSLRLAHSSQLYVTVVAENAARLRSVVYADPMMVDFTPPEICCIKDGDKAEDISFQGDTVLKVAWSVKDNETDVKYCEWAVGRSPGSQEVQPFTRCSLSSAAHDFGHAVLHGQTLYSTVRCFNYAGLSSSATSDGVTLVTAEPDVSKATVVITTSSASHFPSIDNHQAETGAVYFGWRSIKDESGIAYYKVTLQKDDGTTVIPWRTIASPSASYGNFAGLHLEAYTGYRLLVTATNRVGLTSDVIYNNFTVETEKPHVIDPNLRINWPTEWMISLDWTGMFSSNSSLLFEITMGTTAGGIDVLPAMTTEMTTLQVTGLDNKKLHYVTLTAINKAGLYTTKTFQLSKQSADPL